MYDPLNPNPQQPGIYTMNAMNPGNPLPTLGAGFNGAGGGAARVPNPPHQHPDAWQHDPRQSIAPYLPPQVAQQLAGAFPGQPTPLPWDQSHQYQNLQRWQQHNPNLANNPQFQDRMGNLQDRYNARVNALGPIATPGQVAPNGQFPINPGAPNPTAPTPLPPQPLPPQSAPSPYTGVPVGAPAPYQWNGYGKQWG